MERKMVELINSEIKQFNEFANQLDVDAFSLAVYESFKEALTNMHYVVLIPINLDMYYTHEQHKDFEKCGFHRSGSEERYSNLFFATNKVVDEMVEILKYEGMVTDAVYDNTNNTNIVVVTLNGIKDSNYMSDYQNSVE